LLYFWCGCTLNQPRTSGLPRRADAAYTGDLCHRPGVAYGRSREAEMEAVDLLIEPFGIERLVFVGCYVLLAILGGALLGFIWERLLTRYKDQQEIEGTFEAFREQNAEKRTAKRAE
jgi:hypothetical protein